MSYLTSVAPPPPVIQSVDEFVQNYGVKMCVYGRAGLGKTTLIRTLPNPIIISSEQGLLSLKGANLPMLRPVFNLTDLKAHYALLNTPAMRQQFQSVAIDSLSDVAEVILYDEKQKTKNGQKAYGEMNEQVLADVFRAFRNLQGYNVYFTAKEEWDKDEQTGMQMYRPSMPGKVLTRELPFAFDELFRYEVGRDANGQEWRALRTRPTPNVEAKDRSGRLNEYEWPDLGQIITKMLG